MRSRTSWFKYRLSHSADRVGSRRRGRERHVGRGRATCEAETVRARVRHYLIVALASLAVPVPAGAAEVGVVADVTWGQARPAIDREIDLLQAAGVDWIRANANWKALEPDRRGSIDARVLADYDYAVDRARDAGIEVLMPIADGVPYWASGDPRKRVDEQGERHWNATYPPADMADYGRIVRLVADHFTRRGVRAYEIWNEPNLDDFWGSGPDPAAYVRMLRAGAAAVRSADPNATVVLGGLSENDVPYLEGVYRAGGGRSFDAVAVHPYTFGAPPVPEGQGRGDRRRSLAGLSDIRQAMVRHGDAPKKIWITEFGYSTTTEDGGVSEAEQARYLRQAYAYVNRLPWVHSMFWYQARNNPFGGDGDSYGDRFGLMTTDFRPKPSYRALGEVAARDGPPRGLPLAAVLLAALAALVVLRRRRRARKPAGAEQEEELEAAGRA